jgi:TonB family protein
MITLLDIALRSSVVLLIGLALVPLLRKQSAALRHWVLFTSLVCAAAVPLIDRFAPEWRAPVDLTLPAPRAALSTIAAPTTTQLRSERAVGEGSNLLPSTTAEISWSTVLLSTWLTGVLISLATLALGLWRLARINAKATEVCDGPLIDILRRLHRAHGLARSIRVLALEQPALLLVWGMRRPTIIVPAAARTWPTERIDAVLNHELAHVRRDDWILLIASEIIRAVYWFNPLVWLTCARMRTECEVACDDMVIGSGAPGSEYASHVVAVAKDLSTNHWVPAPAIVRASTLERRVRAMLDKTSNRRPLSPRLRSAALALLLAATVAVAGLAQSFVSLSGTIVDPSNAFLPDVKLVLTNEQTQAKYEIRTDRSGRYEFVGLPPGTYTLDAALPGFARFVNRVTVGGQNLQQDVALSVGTLQETVTVTPDATPPAPRDPEALRKLEEVKQKRAAATCPEPQARDASRMGGNIRVPLKYRDAKPRFPESLRGTEGVVVLDARIGTDGLIEDVEVVSSTHAEFTDSAVEAVKQWVFDATLLNCEPVATPMQVTVNYKTR